MAAPFISADQPQLHTKPKRVTWPQSFAIDDNSSQTSESSSIAFPELQQLPKEAKSSIWQFLRERILSFETRNEEVPFKIRSLADATREVDEEDEYEYEEEGDAEIESEGGPYGTILHTACAVGTNWLLELQIKAGVDVTAVDRHSWTALMVAVAQGHSICAKSLSEYMETIAAHPTTQPLSPSGLVKADSSTSIRIGDDGLTATPGSWRAIWLQRRVQVRSNHPIPPDSSSFYYEMTILNSGPLGYVIIDRADSIYGS